MRDSKIKFDESFWGDLHDCISDELTPVTFDEEAVLQKNGTHPLSHKPTIDIGIMDMHQTFLAVLSNHLNPLCRYMKAFAKGEENFHIFEIMEMIIASTIPKLEEVDLVKP